MYKKVTIEQPFTIAYEADIDEDLYKLTDNEVLENMPVVADVNITDDLKTYFKTQPKNTDWGSLCDDIIDVNFYTDYDRSVISLDLTLRTDFTDEQIKDLFDGFMSEYFSGELDGEFTMNIEPIQSEPFESGYNPLKDEIEYSTDTINSITVNFEFNFDESQQIQIEDLKNYR